jgi:TPR repeat protein
MARLNHFFDSRKGQAKVLLRAILILCALTPAFTLAATHEAAEAAVRTRDFAKAAELYLEMAKAGDKDAQFALGNLYRSGRGVKKDYEQAFVWFSKAAEQGHVSAQYTTGTMYENGWGVKADTDKAREWYKQAADGGHRLAAKKLKVLASGSPVDDLDRSEKTELLNLAGAAGKS